MHHTRSKQEQVGYLLTRSKTKVMLAAAGSKNDDVFDIGLFKVRNSHFLSCSYFICLPTFSTSMALLNGKKCSKKFGLPDGAGERIKRIVMPHVRHA